MLRRRVYLEGRHVVGAGVPHEFRGPNGNTALGYQWSWTWGNGSNTEPHNRDVHRVSDWARANRCAHCGKKIVHAYWVKKQDGSLAPYGSKHLHVALGYPYALSAQEIDKIRQTVGEQGLSDFE